MDLGPLGPLGQRLRQRRNGLGLGLRETASQVGISLTYLSLVERGVTPTAPSETVLRELARVLGDSPDDLLHLAGRIPEDVQRIILGDRGWPRALRLADSTGVIAEDVLELLGEPRPQPVDAFGVIARKGT